MADDDYSDFEPVNPEADVAQLEGSDYSGFIPESTPLDAGAKQTHYGYPGDSTPDWNSAHAIGDRDNHLSASPGHHSVALTQAERSRLFGVTGSSTGRYVGTSNNVNYYDEDTAPEGDRRIDVFDPGSKAIDYVPGKSRSKDDYSGFIAENQQQPTGQDDYSEFKPASEAVAPAEQQPAAKPQETNPWDVGKFLQTFVGSGVQQILGSEKGQAESQLHPETRQVLPYEEQVQQAKEDAILKNPNTSQEEADDIIHQRNQRLAYVKANAEQNVQETTSALKESGSRVDQRYESTAPGQVAKTLGAGGASLIPGLTGPAAPLTLATQMGGAAYSEEKDRAVTAAKKAHPEWSDDQIEAASTQAAENAARTSAESGIVLSLLPVPKLGGLLARVVERVGMRGAYMVVAGAAQDISANKELQNIDPKQALYDGVLARMPANFVAGGAFELPGAIGEAVTGRPNAAPESTQETPEAQPEAKAPETPQAPEKVVAAAVRYGDQIGTGNIHAQAIEDLASRGVKGENPDDFYQNSENGYVTDTGRFITREEADQMTGRGKDSLSVVQPEAQPEQAPEDTDKWISAIANRYSQERSAQGEIGEIAPGEGYSRTDLREVGLKMSPEEINQHVSDLMHDTGNPKLQAAAISAEEARLSQRSSQLSRISEDNPNDQQAKIDADNAFKDLTDFHNGPVAKLKNNWHAQGMTLQGEVPVDLSTFNGLREAWLRDVGTRINPSLEMTMRNTAKRVRNAVSAEDMAMQRLGQEIEKPARKSLPSDEQVRNNIMARMKNEPCRT